MKIKHNITTDYFIHNIYIEIARNVFNNPFLFYDNNNTIEIKKNQRDILNLIKNSIKETLSLEQNVEQRRGTMSAELENVHAGNSTEATPCETYILKRLGQQELNISTPTYNTNAPSGRINTTIAPSTAPPALDAQLFE